MSSTEFEEALIGIIREEISKKNDVRIEGLGTFHAYHTPQNQVQYKNGKVVRRPPKDSITFTPDKK